MKTPLSTLLLRALLVAAALTLGFAHPAAAATPCWKTLLNDWYDGRIDHTYARHCYTDALHHLPTDVQTYSSAHDDILRALQSAMAADRKAGRSAGGPNALVPPPPNQPKRKTHATTSPGRKTPGGLSGLADKLNPSSPSSLPLPLLVLGALAILLVLAGGAGLVAKRFQNRPPRAS